MRFSSDGIITLIILFLVGMFVASKIRKESYAETWSALLNKITGGNNE